MTPDLMIPPSWLPGPLPMGAPVVATADTLAEWAPLTIGAGWRGVALPDREVAWLDDRGEAWGVAPPDDGAVALDLTPPAVDANGYPLCVDGLDVAVALLGRALGMAERPRWAEFRAKPFPHLALEGLRGAYGDLSEMEVPALADIDPADPLATRRAVIEVFRRRVWETP